MEEEVLGDIVYPSARIRAGLDLVGMRDEARTKGPPDFSMDEIAEETRMVSAIEGKVPKFIGIQLR